MQTQPSLTETLLKSLHEILGLDSIENLRKGVIAFDNDPLQAFNFFLKAITSDRESDSVENLRKGILSFNQDPLQAFNFFLKAISHGANENSVDCLRKAIVNFNNDPLQSFDFFLKAIAHQPGSELTENLRKAVLNQKSTPLSSIDYFLKVLFSLTAITEINDLRKTIAKFPNENWHDALSLGQINSKKWLVEKVRTINVPLPDLGYIYGGWFGALPWIANLMEFPLAKQIRSFDIDESCYVVAETLNKQAVINSWTFKAVTKDIKHINYKPHVYDLVRPDGTLAKTIENPDLIINTSCEHIADHQTWYSAIPKGTLVILQSNNFFAQPTHLNCVKDVNAMAQQFPMNEKLYEGTLNLLNYDRFMLIGYK